jgi:hypothetical protein
MIKKPVKKVVNKSKSKSPKPSKKLIKLAKRYSVRLTRNVRKSNGTITRKYKSEKVLKTQIRNEIKRTKSKKVVRSKTSRKFGNDVLKSRITELLHEANLKFNKKKNKTKTKFNKKVKKVKKHLFNKLVKKDNRSSSKEEDYYSAEVIEIGPVANNYVVPIILNGYIVINQIEFENQLENLNKHYDKIVRYIFNKNHQSKTFDNIEIYFENVNLIFENINKFNKTEYYKKVEKELSRLLIITAILYYVFNDELPIFPNIKDIIKDKGIYGLQIYTDTLEQIKNSNFDNDLIKDKIYSM